MTLTMRHIDVWLFDNAGDNFAIEIKHSTLDTESSYGEGVNKWFIYAYVYPKHPLFAEFDSTENIFQPVTESMPLHGGCSYLKKNFSESGQPRSIQVGCDYLHLWDERFSHYVTKEDASEVFEDAEALYNYLKKRDIKALEGMRKLAEGE